MPEQFYTILTKVGMAKISNAYTLGNKVNFKTLAIGDGGGSYYDPVDTQNNLKNEVWRGNINSITTDKNNPNWIVIEIAIPSMEGGFMIREAGIFDTDGDLIAIGKYPETYKPVAAQGSSKDLYLKMILEVSNSSVVNLKIDPSVVIATKKDIEGLAKKDGTIQSTLNADMVDGKHASEFATSQQMELFIKKLDLANTTSGSSGAKLVGVSTIAGLRGNDVQTCLQNLFQFANDGKIAVANAIVGKSVSASNSDTFATLANKIGQINTGKKYASGTLVVSNNKYNYKTSDTPREFNYAEVRGLNFEPSLIVIYGAHIYGNKTYNTPHITIHCNDSAGLGKYRIPFKSIVTGCGTAGFIDDYNSTYYNGSFFGGFRLPVFLNTVNDNKKRKWIAIE